MLIVSLCAAEADAKQKVVHHTTRRVVKKSIRAGSERKSTLPFWLHSHHGPLPVRKFTVDPVKDFLNGKTDTLNGYDDIRFKLK
jgi:hypothetical protein